MTLKSLKKRDSKLAKAKHQLKVLSNGIFLDGSLPTFADKIKASKKSPLQSKNLEILQVNVAICVIKSVRIAMWMLVRIGKRL